MTRQEHIMMISLFTKQTQLVKMLINLLKSRGIATDDDVTAFEFAALVDQQSNAAIFRDVSNAYLTLAKGMGIDTGIETPCSAPL